MAAIAFSLNSLILSELAQSERRILTLTVALRHMIDPAVRVKGDLAEIVRSALRGLVAAKWVRDEDGVYSLTPEGEIAQATDRLAPKPSRRGRRRTQEASALSAI